MKKFLAWFAVIILVGVLSLSLVAFTHIAPKKLKAEIGITSDTVKAHCSMHQEIADSAACKEHDKTAETKACCKEAGKTASGECNHAETCKHHKEVAAEAK